MSKEFPITISSWTLGDQCKFEDRVKAAKEAGYEGIGLRAETYVDALNEGLFDEDILAILDKYDMKVTEVEYIVQWAEEHRSYEQKYKEQLCFHMCELFNVKQINCGLMENYSVEYTAQKLRELCHRAGKYIIGVEPMPYSGIPDVKKGWAVVKAADCENAKLILDTWHWVRANQPIELSVLEGIPAPRENRTPYAPHNSPPLPDRLSHQIFDLPSKHCFQVLFLLVMPSTRRVGPVSLPPG